MGKGVLSMTFLYSGGSFYSGERKQDIFFLVKIFIYLFFYIVSIIYVNRFIFLYINIYNMEYEHFYLIQIECSYWILY